MLKVIDTHTHFWDLSKLSYPWLDHEGWRHLRSTFVPADLKADSVDVVATVHVQAEMDHQLDPVVETQWLGEVRSASPDAPVPTVAVGFADLTGADLEDVLDRHQTYDFFRGIRQEAWYDPASTSRELEHDVDLLANPRWEEGLRVLAGRGLTFDLLVYAHQLPRATSIFESVPDLRVVIDHLGHPSSSTSAAAWRSDLKTFRDRVPNAFIKLSGLSFVAKSLGDPIARQSVRQVLDIFGPERCMLASNFPVDRSLGSYDDIWSAFDSFTSDLSAHERAQIFVGTASEFYDIDVD